MGTVLITGSEGNIGTYLVRYLEMKYPELRIIRVKLRENSSEPEKIGSMYIGDLQDKIFVEKIFQENQIDYVIHMAARLYGVAGFNKDIHGLFHNDIECLLHVLNNSKKVKKFVYMSSSMMYESSEKVPFSEDLTETIMPPKSSYGLTKYFGEKAIIFFHQQYGVKYTLWRPFNAVSPLESHEREGGHVFVDFYRKIFVEKLPKIEIYGNGRQVRCFTWVEDLVQGIGDGLLDPRTDNEIFNIGSNEPKTMFELKDILVQIGKEKNYLPKDYNPATATGNEFYGIDVQLRIPTVEKIAKALGWKHKTDFKACFEKFIDYKQKIHGNQ